MKQVTVDTVTTDKQGLALDLKALALALWEATVTLVNQHRIETGIVLGAVCLVLMLAVASAFTSPQVTADTLTPDIERQVRQDCAGILNAKGVSRDGKISGCLGLAAQNRVALKGINE